MTPTETFLILKYGSVHDAAAQTLLNNNRHEFSTEELVIIDAYIAKVMKETSMGYD